MIEEVNRHAVTTPQAAAKLLADAANQNILLLTNRQGSKRYIALSSGGDGALE